MIADTPTDPSQPDFQRTLTLHASIMDLLVILSGKDRPPDKFIALVKERLAVVVESLNNASGGEGGVSDPLHINWVNALQLARLSDFEGMDGYLRGVSASIYESENRGLLGRFRRRCSVAEPPKSVRDAAHAYQQFQDCLRELNSLRDKVSFHTGRFPKLLDGLKADLAQNDLLAFAMHPFNTSSEVGQARLLASRLVYYLFLWRNKTIEILRDGYGRVNRSNFAYLLETNKGKIDADLEEIARLNNESGDPKLEFFVTLVRGICEDSIFFEAYLNAAVQCVAGERPEIGALNAVRNDTGVDVDDSSGREQKLVVTFTNVVRSAGDGSTHICPVCPAMQLANDLKKAFERAIKFGLIEVGYVQDQEKVTIHVSPLVGDQGIVDMIRKANKIAAHGHYSYNEILGEMALPPVAGLFRGNPNRASQKCDNHLI